MVEHTRARGAHGEHIVAQYLEQRGFTIIARNYTLRCGELDLVACQGSLLVFVEVKMCSNDAIDPGELVPVTKQHKIIRTALTYIAQHQLDALSYRFDVACVITTGAQPAITYIPGAFEDIA